MLRGRKDFGGSVGLDLERFTIGETENFLHVSSGAKYSLLDRTSKDQTGVP